MSHVEIIDSTGEPGKVLSLTFDDGPHPQHTPDLLRVLREHQVTAVFCLWGDHVQQHPQIVQEIVADGHTLGNHSMHHDHLGTWHPDDVRADLLQAQAAIQQAVPHAPIPYFRAPYGEWGQSPQVAVDLGMRPLGWRLDVEDWVPPGPDELVRRLLAGVTPGAVVLLHDAGGDRSQTVAAVDRIIPVLKADGWRFTPPAGC